MEHLLSVSAGYPAWAACAASLLAGVLPDATLAILRRGFGRGGFGGRRGSFGLFRVLFVLLFTTVLGPIVLVALVAFLVYRFFVSRRG